MQTDDFTHTSFQTSLAEHKLMGSRCTSCGELYLPPRPKCSKCFSNDMSWQEYSGKGRLIAFTTIHIAPTAMIEAGYGRDNPYCSGVVQLDDGPSISAQIVGVDVNHPESIHIDTPLEVEYLERGEGEKVRTFLTFKAIN
jgi:uncharacterized OB-fold protein